MPFINLIQALNHDINSTVDYSNQLSSTVDYSNLMSLQESTVICQVCRGLHDGKYMSLHLSTMIYEL